MKLQEVRLERGLGQKELAEKIGVSVPMVSNFECYKCLPVPNMLGKICEELKCTREDIYEDNELYVLHIKSHLRPTLKTERQIYKLSVRLPDSARYIFTQENLEKCGYHSLKDFIWHCYKRFEKQLEVIEKNEKVTKDQQQPLVTNEKRVAISTHCYYITSSGKNQTNFQKK